MALTGLGLTLQSTSAGTAPRQGAESWGAESPKFRGFCTGSVEFLGFRASLGVQGLGFVMRGSPKGSMTGGLRFRGVGFRELGQ